ncbi:MAG: tetratricopeptide repeat protein, partial [Chloroflexota bacterium]
FRKILKIKPYNAATYMKRGLARCAMEQFKQALGDFDESLRRDDTNPDAYMWRAVAHFQLDQYMRAYEDLERAGRYRPRDPEIRQYKQMVLAKLRVK